MKNLVARADFHEGVSRLDTWFLAFHPIEPRLTSSSTHTPGHKGISPEEMSSQGYSRRGEKSAFEKADSRQSFLRFQLSFEIKILFSLLLRLYLCSSLIGFTSFFTRNFVPIRNLFSEEISYRLQTTRSQQICGCFRNRSYWRYRVDGLFFFFFFRCLLCRKGKEKEGWRRRKDTRREIINSARTRVFFSPRWHGESRLSPGRAALKGFLNKPITIRGGVIINEAPAGKAR